MFFDKLRYCFYNFLKEKILLKLKDEISKLKKKGFTLTELIVLIAVLGILVLMAAPKFLGYTADAKMK